MDEIFSYSLSNGEKGVYLFQEASEIDNKLLKRDIFEKYLSQNSNTSFSKMWHNLKYDNHMPLFFALLHTVSNLFPPVFTPYPGIVLNLITLILLLIIFYKLSYFVFKDKEIALATTSLFSFTEGVLFLEIFIRMYLLQMLCSTALFFAITKLITNDVEKKEKLFYNIIFLSMITILTHYYSILFCFILTAIGSFIIILQKKYLNALKYALAMVSSLLLAYIIYPSMLNVGTKGERGEQFVSTLDKFIENPLEIISNQLPLFTNTFFKNNHIAIFVFLLFLFLVFYSKKILTNKERYIFIFSYLTFFAYGILSSLIMPNMESYQIRYFSPIIPLEIILITYFSIILFRLIKARTFLLHIFLWLIVAVNGYYISIYQNSAFYLRGDRKIEKTAKIVKDAEIWWGLGGGNAHSWMIYNYIDKLRTADKVWTLVDFNHPEFLTLAQKGKNNKKYAYLFMPKAQENIPEGAQEWIRNTTNRQGYYMYTIKNQKKAATAFEASIFLVCPF